jgi:hypothetical protein
MRSLLLLPFLLAGIGLFAQGDAASCLVKARSAWGEPAERCHAYTEDLKRDNRGNFTLELRNTCRDILEVKVAMEETGGTWRTFPLKALAAGEVITTQACHATGKYMYWARKAGDTELALPTDAEIASQYRSR